MSHGIPRHITHCLKRLVLHCTATHPTTPTDALTLAASQATLSVGLHCSTASDLPLALIAFRLNICPWRTFHGCVISLPILHSDDREPLVKYTGLDHTLTTGVISGLGREISSGINGRPIQVGRPHHACSRACAFPNASWAPHSVT